MRIRKKIRPSKLNECDGKYAKLVMTHDGGGRGINVYVKPKWADDVDSWLQGDLVDKYAYSICIAVDEFDRFRVHNAIGCINDPFNREELMKSQQAETVRRLVSNAYLELNERSFSIMDSVVSLGRGVESGFIFWNWMPSSWIPSSTESTEVLNHPLLRSLYKTNNILTKKKGRHSRGRCGYQGRKPR